MKKITYTVKQQARRTRALARFAFDSAKSTDEGYMMRKLTEQAALHTRLGSAK